MPPLEHTGRVTSFFEFWPMWLFYMPVVLQWLILAIRYRSLSLPLIANPAIPLSGMVGVPKSAVFEQAGSQAQQKILPWCVYEVSKESVDQQVAVVRELLAAHELQFPLVGKPNIGCRGAGVKLLHDAPALAQYIARFPLGGQIQFQQLAPWEAEAGVFYTRYPDAAHGAITSLTLKYTPGVVGNGVATLGELVAADPRAGGLQHLYQQRHKAQWNSVLQAGEKFRLVFSASHCRGAVFRDASEHATEKLTRALDTLFADIPDYYYGRLDIKFKDIDSLRAGLEFAVIEINGASSESINIWDRNTSFFKAILTLLQQYHTLFKLGNANRRLGHTPPGILALYRAWRHENKLTKQYPTND